MIVLLKLLLAHLIADFLLQPRNWVLDKEQKKAGSGKLYLHVLLHGILTLLLLWDWSFWWMALLIMVMHGLVDIIKLYAQTEATRVGWFIADQLLHGFTLIAVWYAWFQPEFHPIEESLHSLVWVYATAVLFLTAATGIIIQILLTNFSKQISDGPDESLASAGKYIGILERLLIFVFIVTGHWEGVGFLLAAKSIFRFGDLKESKDRKLTEYILIGTLLSFGIAIITGITVVGITAVL
ncbi:MAG: DUF3307 domain-containing protein [Bacteroidia bacterium]